MIKVFYWREFLMKDNILLNKKTSPYRQGINKRRISSVLNYLYVRTKSVLTLFIHSFKL